MNTIVLKFGGTSVADNEKLNLVANKITTLYDEGHNVVVVVSAQGKKTDQLLNEACELDKTPNSRELDVLLSSGEQVSISKLSILLNQLGYKSISLTGWQAGIFTNNTNQNAIIEHIDTSRITKELSLGKIVIIAGFQGINSNSDITTLGRGGSDTTAISVAAALNARECYIYSDVEGVFTSDPKKVAEARKLKEVSYLHSEAYQAGELKHGTISLVEENMPVLCVITNQALKDKSISNLKETEARGAFGIVITTKDLDDFEDYTKIVVPTTSMFTQSMLVVPALQLLSYYVALKRGCDIDKPRNLAKSVTVE